MKILKFSACMLLGAFCAGAHAQDVQMNPLDALGAQGNHTTQSETNHAVTARGILAAWNDSSQLATTGVNFTSLIRWGYSTSGGASFAHGGFFTLDGPNCLGDPAVVADGSGFFYLAALASESPSSRSRKNLAVARSTGNTAPFAFGKPLILEPIKSTGMLDKALMAVDRTGGAFNGRLYISATDLTQGIVVTHMTSPLNFSPWQLVADDINATGSMPAVAPNGDLYVIWTAEPNALRLVKSSNGGGTFINPDPADPAPAKTIATFRPPPLLKTFLKMRDRNLATDPFAQIAVDSTGNGSPTRGNVYVVFAADPDGGGPDQSDVYFTRSIDGGASWTVPRSITSGPAVTLGQDPTTNDSWMPSIAVSPVNGHIYVTFYDRRDDTTRGDGDPVNTRTRVFRALSTDGGLTWANAPLGAQPFVPVVGFLDAGASNDYWGEYNWSTADASGMHFTWGDSHKLCSPPPVGSSKCDPPGRPDLDVYYHKVANLSGPDLFIQPWGAVTGIGPSWQTPDVFVVDKRNQIVNARKGIANRLRAHVRNLGNARVNHVVVRFRYAPLFAGVNDSLLKEIGTVRLNFSEAGRVKDTQIAGIDWDLTNLGDTNGGRWPARVGAFQHFRVKVTVELTDDVNLSNNVAQNNFDDVVNAASPARQPDLRGIGPVTAAYWNVKPPPKPPDHPSTPGFERPLPPPRTLPEGVQPRYRRTFAAGYEAAFQAGTESFRQQEGEPALVNRERGLINSRAERLTAEQIRGLAAAEDQPRVTGDGYAIVSIYFQPLSENETEIGAASLIAVDDGSPLGRVLTSNGTLENSYLDAMTSRPKE